MDTPWFSPIPGDNNSIHETISKEKQQIIENIIKQLKNSQYLDKKLLPFFVNYLKIFFSKLLIKLWKKDIRFVTKNKNLINILEYCIDDIFDTKIERSEYWISSIELKIRNVDLVKSFASYVWQDYIKFEKFINSIIEHEYQNQITKDTTQQIIEVFNNYTKDFIKKAIIYIFYEEFKNIQKNSRKFSNKTHFDIMLLMKNLEEERYISINRSWENPKFELTFKWINLAKRLQEDKKFQEKLTLDLKILLQTQFI